MPRDDDSLSDLNTFNSEGQENPSGPESLGDERTLDGAFGGGGPQSLGDEATFGGETGSVDDAFDDDMEIIDLAGRYTTEGKLGEGGMGEVLLATDTRLNRKVAIKRILGSAARSKTAVSRFLTEAQSIGAVNHPNIVQIYDYGRAQDGPFLIMEFVEGSSLLDKCREGPVPLEEAIDLTCQLCDGLSKAHAANIVHRDIKPANVLLTEDGVPKLTDFGLAKDEAADTGMTMAGAVLGTLDFMPPEQRKDAALTDNRSDLWSLAATLYQMVTGKSPKIIKFNDVPQALQGVLGKALEDEKDDRYQNAVEFRDALRECLTADGPDLSELDEGQCPKCGTKNDSSRRFCRNTDCGASLEVPCLSCSTKIPMWEGVCGDCGAMQEPLLEERREEMAAQRLEAEQCVPDHHYARALQIAQQLSDETDLRLQQYKTWSEQFIEEVQTERDRELQRVAELLAESLKHEEAHDYPAGIKTLQQVAEPIRKDSIPGHKETVATLLSRLSRKQKEVESLEKQIRERIAQRQLDNLMPKVEKLLTLVPTRTDILKLKDQLIARDTKLLKVRENSYAEAMEAFNAQDYLTCLAALKKIDPSLQDEEVRELRESAQTSNERVKTLDQQITAALTAKQFDGLLEQVEEYLFLQQADTERQKVRDQLITRQKRQLAQVKTLLGNASQLRDSGKYESSLAKLQQIPQLLRNDEVRSLEESCNELHHAKKQAIAALGRARQSGEYSKELSTASIYHAMLDRHSEIDDAEFRQLYTQAQEALEEQKNQAVAAEKRQKNMKLAGIAGAGAVAVLVLLGIGLWANSAFQASKLASAVQGQRWEEVLSIDPDNVTGLLGRAKQRLNRSDSNLDSILADVERAESLDPALLGTDKIKGTLFALQSVEASENGDVETAEAKLQEAERLKVDSSYEFRATAALAKAFIQLAETSVASGNIAQAVAEAKRARELDSTIKTPPSIALATSESKATGLVKAYEEGPNASTRDAATAALLSLASMEGQATMLSTLRSRIESVLFRSITAFESKRSDENLLAAQEAVTQLQAISSNPTILSSANTRIAKALVRRFGEIPLDQALSEVALLEDLNADTATKEAAKRAVGSPLIDRFRDSLNQRDYESARDDYAAIASLDPKASEQLTSDWRKIPDLDYAQVPVAVLSKFPTSILSNLPDSVISELPPRPNSIGMKFKLIPAGTYVMGSDSGNARDKPKHKVTLSKPFEFGVYEVTQEQYQRVMGTNPSEFKGPQNPVETVSWENAVEFCKKLSALPSERSAGRDYRLPTEAEWEYACRAGTTTAYTYVDGEAGWDLRDYAWYLLNSGEQTHPVGQKSPNAWGLYDVCGNVCEWCSDWFGAYPDTSVTDPMGAATGSFHVARGGSWGGSALTSKSAHRLKATPMPKTCGFRVVCVSSGQ